MQNIVNPVTISHSEYATTWFLIGILLTTIVAVVVHFKIVSDKNIK